MLIFALGPAGRQRFLRWLDRFLLAHLLKKIALLDKGKPGWSMSMSMSIGIGWYARSSRNKRGRTSMFVDRLARDCDNTGGLTSEGLE